MGIAVGTRQDVTINTLGSAINWIKNKKKKKKPKGESKKKRQRRLKHRATIGWSSREGKGNRESDFSTPISQRQGNALNR